MNGKPKNVLLILLLGAASFILPSLVMAGEVGEDDFQISFMGSNDDYDADDPTVAYNSVRNEYLVVWDADAESLLGGKNEIWGQRLDAATGALLEERLRISVTETSTSTSYDSVEPHITYNPQTNQYLVVWSGDLAPNDGAQEIWGQLVNGDGGLSGSRVRISTMGASDADSGIDANNPRVTYDSTLNRYFIVWYTSGSDGGVSLHEIYGTLIDHNLSPINSNFRLSDMGVDESSTQFRSFYPDVVYNSQNQEYVVIWQGDDLVDGENEIYGQRVSAATGFEIDGDFRISQVGDDGDPAYDALWPHIAYNSTDNNYLVVWYGNDNVSPVGAEDYEIFGQFLDENAAVQGDYFLVSDLDPNPYYEETMFNDIIYNHLRNEYLIAWRGVGPLAGYAEEEIFGQRLSASGLQIGENDFRVSHVGDDMNSFFEANFVGLAFNSDNDEYLFVWDADHFPSNENNQYDVYGQRYQSFAAVSLAPSSSDNEAKSFPNPFDPDEGLGVMTIYDLPAHAKVTIFNMHGEKIHQFTATSDGTVLWPGYDASGDRVSTGIYYGQVNDGKTFKLAVEN